ncbi:proline-rich protein 12 [Aplochiton taeniatus]
MDRNYPGTGFGDLGAGTGWSYERSAKASLVYGSSRSSHPDSELLHRQAYGTPHPLQGYATNHHPGSSAQGGAWGAAGRSLGLSGLFDAGLHHGTPSGPDPSVMNLISALESRGPQPPPSASSLLSQFRTPSWQPAMHTSAPAELFISGTLPGSGSYPSSSALSAYQHPASFSGRSFTPSLSLQDTPTFSPTPNGLLSPHEPLLHIKTPSQSGLGFDRLLSSQSAATAYRGVQDPSGAPTQASASSSGRHLPHPQFNLLSSQLQDQSSQLYNASMFSSAPAPPGQLQPPQERTIPRQDSVIKHYQRSSSAQSQLASATPHPLQHYLSSGGVSGYQQMAPHHRHAGMTPLGEQSPSSEPKSSQRAEPQVYRPIIQPPYTPSSASSSTAGSKAAKSSSSSSGYSSSGSVSSSRTPHTPPSASSTSSSTSSSSSNSAAGSSSAPSRQQPPPQAAPPPPPPPPLPVVSATPTQQSQPKPCLSAYGSPVPPVKSSGGLPGQTPPQQSYSPGQPQPTHMTQPYGGFSSPQDLSSRTGVSGAKGYGGLGAGGRSFSAEVVYGSDSGYGSLPTSLGGAGSPSMGYGGPGHSPALLVSGVSGVATASGSGSGAGGGGVTGGAGAGPVGGASGVGTGGSSYHLHDSSPSPSSSSAIIRPGLHSPTPAHPSQSPGAGGNKYLSSVLSPAFLSSPQGYPEARSGPTQSYHPTPPKPKSDADLLGVEHSQDEEDDDDDDFLIQHLLQAQSPAPHSSQHHPQPPPPLQQQQQQPPQSLPQTRDGVAKGLTYDMHKASEERYHLQSVIRTNSTTNSTATGPVSSSGASGLEDQLEMSLKKQQQQAKVERTMSGMSSRGGRGATDSLSNTHAHLPHPQLHDSLGSVVHYGRSDLYSQHPHSQHPHHSSHVPQHSQQHAHQAQHSQLPHTHARGHPHIELKKTPDSADIIPYLRKTPDLQQQVRQSQASLSLLDSSPDQPQQSSATHMLQPVPSHSTSNKMESQPPPQQQHPRRQQAMMGSAGGLDPHPQNQSSQLQLQLQSHAMDARYGRGAQLRDQSQGSQNSVSPLDMLEQSLSRANNCDSGGGSKAVGNVGLEVGGGGDGGHGDQHRQHRLSAHHQPHHAQQSTASDLHDFLSEPDLGLSAPSHLHHLSAPQQHHSHPHSQHQQQAHPHHQLSHSHVGHPHAQQLVPNVSAPQQQQQQHQQHQQREAEPQLSQAQLDQLKEHPYDTVSPVGKAAQSQAQQQQQQQQRFVPLTSICFPDSLLQDEDRSYFPGMEEIFCAEDYKSSCAGGTSGGQGVQEGISQECGQGPESMEAMKAAGGPGGFDMMGHHTDQGYGQYCHGLSETGNGSMHLDLDSLKTHELPSTVNTEQLGLIQSQTTGLGMGGVPRDGAGNKMSGGQGVGGTSGTSGLTSPIFCSSRPKKLLKTSSFHLLKQRREPQPPAKKNYAQEYEFEDDEDKADVPADIRLNSRRLPDLLPDLVSSCRKAGAAPGAGSLSPLMGELDFCHPSGFSTLGPPPLLLPHDGPKKRGRKPTKPKREGPPRPRGRPRIRPLPEPPYCRGIMGAVGGESRRGRGRGRGRGKREDGAMEMHRDISKIQNLQYQQQQFQQQQHLQPQHQHHAHHLQPNDQPVPPLSQQHPHHQQPQQHLHHQQQLHHHHQQQQQRQQQQQQQQQQFQQPQHKEPIRPIKIKLPIPSITPTDSLLRTDSLSSNDPVLSDGSVGSAPSLGLSPGPTSGMDMNRTDLNRTQEKMMKQKVEEMTWEREIDEQMTPEAWAAMQKLSSSTEDKTPELKPGLIASFLDFLKTGKKESGMEAEPTDEDSADSDSLKDEIRPLSTPPPPAPSTQPPAFGDGAEREASLALSNCPSPCKRLDEELKRNLETLPSFSSDEEDSVSKNQDLQKSISSAISALYDMPHSLAVAMAAAVAPAPPTPSPPSTQAPALSPPPTAMPLAPHTPEDVPVAEVEVETHALLHTPAKTTPESLKQLDRAGVMDSPLGAHVAPGPPSPSPPPSTASSSSPSPLPPLPLSVPSPPPLQQDEIQDPEPGQPSSSSSSSPYSSSPPPSPLTPEDAPPPRITSLHLAKKQSDAAIAGQSEEEDSESGGEGIFRERDEFVVRSEDISTLKMALQTGREPPPIWRVQKALLQKFSPEIKDGQRQFCATSNYLGYFGDAKMRYQRLYVKFLENVNKKDYVRVCSRKPWHRPGLTMRRQSLPKPPPPALNHTPPRVEREEREKERHQKEQCGKEREQKEKEERENKDKEKELKEKERREKEKEECKQREREKEREQKESEQRERQKEEQKGREKEREQREKEKERERERREREKGREKEREQQERERREREKEKERAQKESELRERERREKEKENELKERERPMNDKAEPPPKKRKKWLKEVPSASDSDSDQSSEDEGPVRGGVNSRAMREMFRSYVEMLVSTALDPDMIQALEDTDDELYLPPMRKIDSLLNEQKRRLLRRANMSAQHLEAMHMFPKMTADPLDAGTVKAHLSGDGYNRKTLNRVKRSMPKQQDLKLSTETWRIYSLYHSLHHYKYHTFLHCKKETDSIEQAAEDPGQEEVVQQCMANQGWLETLLNSYLELLTLSTKS